MPNQTLTALSVKALRRAAAIKEKIESLRAKLSSILGPAGAEVKAPRRRRKKMSAAARKKIGAAQTKRWAKQKDKASKAAAA